MNVREWSKTHRSPWLVAGIVMGVAVAEAAEVLRHAHDYARRVHPALPINAQRTPSPLEPMLEFPAEVLMGTPVMKSRMFHSSNDGKALAGIWECVGPTRLRWHFDNDETFYILEGAMGVEYDGAQQLMQPGDVAYFRAGSEAVLHVEQRVLKSFTLVEPGRVPRLLRKIL